MLRITEARISQRGAAQNFAVVSHAVGKSSADVSISKRCDTAMKRWVVDRSWEAAGALGVLPCEPADLGSAEHPTIKSKLIRLISHASRIISIFLSGSSSTDPDRERKEERVLRYGDARECKGQRRHIFEGRRLVIIPTSAAPPPANTVSAS